MESGKILRLTKDAGKMDELHVRVEIGVMQGYDSHKPGQGEKKNGEEPGD